MVEAPAALATVDDACEWLGQHRGALLGALAQEGLCCFAAFLCGLRKISMPSLGLSNLRPLPTRSPLERGAD